MVLWLFYKNQKYNLFHLQQKIERWVEQTERYKNFKNPVGISEDKPQVFHTAHKPLGFFSQLFATAFGIVFGVIILLALGIWLLSLIAPPAGTPVQGNTINTQTENAQGVVDNTNRLKLDYYWKLELVGEIQKRTDALGTSATKGHYVEWKLRNNNAIDAGERLATYITEHFKELDAKWASDTLSFIAMNKVTLLRDNQSLEQTISQWEGSSVTGGQMTPSLNAVTMKTGETIQYGNYIVKLNSVITSPSPKIASITVMDSTGKAETGVLTESETIRQQFFSGKIEIGAYAILTDAAGLIITG